MVLTPEILNYYYFKIEVAGKFQNSALIKWVILLVAPNYLQINSVGDQSTEYKYM